MWVYDWPIVSAGLLLLAGSGKRLTPALQLVAILVWIAPLIPLGLLTQASSIATTGFLAAGLGAFAIYRGALNPVRPEADDRLAEILAVEEADEGARGFVNS